MADLRIRTLHKHYGSFHAVKGIDLDVPDGAFAVLVGPSGCGKSTLLRCIAGLEDVSEGSVAIGGRDVTFERPRDRNIAMVFQNYALYPYLNVRENIAFGLRARKFAEADIGRRVARAAEMLDIGHLLERLPRELSGGQRQRVAIGRAVVRDADLFLFDEPLSNLDAQLRDDMRAEIKRLHKDLGRTMIYVTHDQIEAMTLADTIVLLRDGLIEQQGTALELFEKPTTKFVAGFLGSPKMNFLDAVFAASGVTLADGTTLPVKHARKPGEAVTLGVRPQHISLASSKTPPGHARAKAVVEIVQPTGTRMHVNLPLGGANIVAEFDASNQLHPGRPIDIHIDMSRAVLIDPASGKVI